MNVYCYNENHTGNLRYEIDLEKENKRYLIGYRDTYAKINDAEC